MHPKAWTIKDLLKVTTNYLNEKGIDSPRLSAEVLLAHQLKADRVHLYTHFDKPLTNSEVSGYRSLIKRRLKHEPLQYITGLQEFWSLEFMVSPQVLIPRPESELLIELAIEKIEGTSELKNHGLKILDLGTGSGNLAISLAKEFQQSQIWAIDVSSEALDTARLNSQKHDVSEQIHFSQGDLWEPLGGGGSEMAFDMILSNPPYVSSEEYDALSPEIRDYEPRIALDGKEQGMFYIEQIIRGASDYLKEGGWLLIEMAPNQTEKALMMLDDYKAYGEKQRIKDFGHNYRVIMSRRV